MGMGDSGPLGAFLGPLRRKMAGTKHSNVMKGHDLVSFERLRTVFCHRKHPRLFIQLAIGKTQLWGTNIWKNTVMNDIDQDFWANLVNMKREEEGKALIISRSGLQLSP